MMTKTRLEGRHQAGLTYGEAVNPAIEKYNEFIVPLAKAYREFEASIKPDHSAPHEEWQAFLDARREPRAKYKALAYQAWMDLRRVMSLAEEERARTHLRLQDEEAQRLAAGEAGV